MEHRPDTVAPASLAPPYRALFEGLRSRVASLTEHNRRLEHLLRELRRAMFAKKSEKLHPDQLLLAFEELEGALAEADAPASTTPTPRAKRPAAERNIGHLPDHLPRTYEVIEPESTLCPCGCGEMVKIGEDRTERLHIVPAQLQVIVTVRPKYACRKCEEGEPPRVSRRLHSLSLWEERADDFTDKILPGSPGTGGAPGVGSPG